MRIRAIPAFSEFGIWQAYRPDEPTKNLSLYVVGTSSFDLLFSKRYNICYGFFLKQLQRRPAINAVQHPSNIKKVSYRRIIVELW